MRRVAIVGRPNVGKSSLFNRLMGRRVAIVHDQPGVTRDRLAGICKEGPVPFEIIDTGGIGDSPRRRIPQPRLPLPVPICCYLSWMVVLD